MQVFECSVERIRRILARNIRFLHTHRIPFLAELPIDQVNDTMLNPSGAATLPSPKNVMFRMLVPGVSRLHVLASELKIILLPCLEITHYPGEEAPELKIACC